MKMDDYHPEDVPMPRALTEEERELGKGATQEWPSTFHLQWLIEALDKAAYHAAKVQDVLPSQYKTLFDLMVVDSLKKTATSALNKRDMFHNVCVAVEEIKKKDQQ